MDTAVIAFAVLQLIVTADQATNVGANPPRVPTPAEIGALVAAPVLAELPTAQDVTYTDAYYKRLDVHRVSSYALLPLFALQVAAGTRIYAHGSDAPEWARVGHRIGATGVAVLFSTNVATGLPNLIAGRNDPAFRKRRFTHAALMLSATAGFVATGLLSERAEGSPDDRSMHRTVALSSVGLATVGYVLMFDRFRRD